MCRELATRRLEPLRSVLGLTSFLFFAAEAVGLEVDAQHIDAVGADMQSTTLVPPEIPPDKLIPEVINNRLDVVSGGEKRIIYNGSREIFIRFQLTEGLMIQQVLLVTFSAIVGAGVSALLEASLALSLLRAQLRRQSDDGACSRHREQS